MSSPATDHLVGSVLDGRYRVLSHIADGGMASVYVAVDERLDREVALKVMKPSLATDPVFVDRFLFTPMAYPAAYGFIPGTLAADGDPADALVLAPAPMVPGAVIRARPIGMLKMEDESGMDEKIICVPHDKIHTIYKDVHRVEDLPEITRQGIEHFFTRYKDLEPGKWVKVLGWADKAAAEDVIRAAIQAAG